MATGPTQDVETKGPAQVAGRESGLWVEHEQERVQVADDVLQNSHGASDIDEQIRKVQKEQLEIIARIEGKSQHVAQESELVAQARAELELSKQKENDLWDQRLELMREIIELLKEQKKEAEKIIPITAAWRAKTNRRIDEALAEGVEKQEELNDEHRQRITQHDLFHVEHQENQAQMDERVVQIEKKAAEHHETLQKVQAHGNWIVPTVIGLAIVVGAGSLIWLGSKIFGKKKGDDEKEQEGKNGREHARAWTVAPEVSGGYGGVSSQDEDGEYYSD
jgi:hypothetical protein